MQVNNQIIGLNLQNIWLSSKLDTTLSSNNLSL